MKKITLKPFTLTVKIKKKKKYLKKHQSRRYYHLLKAQKTEILFFKSNIFQNVHNINLILFNKNFFLQKLKKGRYIKRPKHKKKYKIKLQKEVKFIKMEGILNITASVNNLFLTYTNLLGKPLYLFSCGQLNNTKKAERSNHFIKLETIRTFCFFLQRKQIKNIYVKINGIGLIKQLLKKALSRTKLNICKIFNITSLPHNGCRLKKYRRI